MIDTASIIATLETVAERHGDPAEKVYSRLFQLHPQLERLFVLDRDGGVRASMMHTSLECLIGVAERSLAARNVISAARLHHDGYGVPEGQFDAMFIAMRDTFRDMLGEEWTPATDAAWSGLLAEIAAIR